MKKIKPMSKEWWIDEIRSHFITILTMFLWYFAGDGATFLFALYSGNYEMVTLQGFIYLVERSAIKTALSLAFPQLFPVKPVKKLETE